MISSNTAYLGFDIAYIFFRLMKAYIWPFWNVYAWVLGYPRHIVQNDFI